MHIDGQSFTSNVSLASSQLAGQLLISRTHRDANGGGTVQLIDDFTGNNATWPFVRRCVARPDASGLAPACFVGPTATPPPRAARAALAYFEAQFLDVFDNLTLYERGGSAYEGEGPRTPVGERTQRWRAHAAADPRARQPEQSTEWTLTGAGLMWAVETNYTVDVPMPGTQHRHIWFNGTVSPAPPGSFDVPAGLTCTPMENSSALYAACRAALLPPSSPAPFRR